VTLRVAAFTGGVDVPSARFRVREMVGVLAEQGIDLIEYTNRLGKYPPTSKLLRPFWGVAVVLDRLLEIAMAQRADLTFLQREMISTLYTVERFTAAPRILDVDDAIWLNRRSTAERIAKISEAIICGNEFLAKQFREWNPNVVVIPTAVDTQRFIPIWKERTPPVIGWSGTSGGLKFMYEIQDSVAEILQSHPGVQLRIVSDLPPKFRAIPASRVEFVKWSAENEVRMLQDLAVGLMPLDDSDWSRGKCSFKMLTYLACGVPVAASGIGMNAEIFRKGNCGIEVVNKDGWVAALRTLLSSAEKRRELGRAGRQIVELDFSVKVVGRRLADVLKQVAGEHPSRHTSASV
jgi:glycosyltransferase involved in cell wall biosynthesis